MNKSTPTILSKDLKVEGELLSSGTIEIEGYVNGTVKSNHLTIREDGCIEGNIAADHLIVKGKFNGSVKAKHISISSKAQVNGNIEYEILSVEDGASIDGQFKKMDNEKIKISKDKDTNGDNQKFFDLKKFPQIK